MTLSPAFLFETSGHGASGKITGRVSANGRTSAGRTVNPARGEIRGCLEAASKLGLDIVYKPHLETQNTASRQAGSEEAEWKANFDVKPDAAYERTLFGEFRDWVSQGNTPDDIRQHRQRVDVILAGELEFSTSRYPGDWKNFVTRMKGSILSPVSVDSPVPPGGIRVGINPNHDPRHREAIADPRRCAQYRELIRSVDFVAPSFYGDFRSTLAPGGASAFRDRQRSVMRRLAGANPSCRTEEYATKPFAAGEMGVGDSFEHTEHNGLPSCAKLPLWYRSRRNYYQNMLAWARSGRPGANDAPLFLNIWSVGVFDPTGAPRSSRNIIHDCWIRKQMWEYSRWRCGAQTAPPSDCFSGPFPAPSGSPTVDPLDSSGSRCSMGYTPCTCRPPGGMGASGFAADPCPPNGGGAPAPGVGATAGDALDAADRAPEE